MIYYRRLPKFEVLKPTSLGEALSILSEHKGKSKVMAGGTDIIPKLKRRGCPTPEYLLDLKSISELDYIVFDNKNGLKIGALASIHSIETSAIVQKYFQILWQAAISMASPQIRNRATIAGNICNAVPSADTAPALLALEARVNIISKKGRKTIPIHNFFTGPGSTVLRDEEILHEIQIPNIPGNAKGKYLKLTQRHAMELAIVGVALILGIGDNRCNNIKISLGAVSPTPMRALNAEAVLRDKIIDKSLIELVARAAANESKPITDHRASAEYRKDMVEVLVKRAFEQILVGN